MIWCLKFWNNRSNTNIYCNIYLESDQFGIILSQHSLKADNSGIQIANQIYYISNQIHMTTLKKEDKIIVCILRFIRRNYLPFLTTIIIVSLWMIISYSKTCLNQTPLGLKNLFSLDRYSGYTGSNYINN